MDGVPTVELLSHSGSDLMVANAARCSFDKQHDTFSVTRDGKLIEFLARGCTKDTWDGFIGLVTSGQLSHEEAHNLLCAVRKIPIHFAPFVHCTATFRFTMPIGVARQWWKSTVGFGLSSELQISEVSRRYVDTPPEYFDVETWRSRAEDKKQGSGEELGRPYEVDRAYHDCLDEADFTYARLLAEGVCPEQSRFVLPLATMTTFWQTGSMAAWARLCSLRCRDDVQPETREIAERVAEYMAGLFPISWHHLSEYH